LADVFSAKTILWATAARLMLGDVPWRRAALNYVLTAYHTCDGVSLEPDAAPGFWEPGAELMAKYMLIVAAGDGGIFDKVVERETPAARLGRLRFCSAFLREAIHARRPGDDLPPGPLGRLLAAIAVQWSEIIGRYRNVAHPELLEGFEQGLIQIYRASEREYDPELCLRTMSHGTLTDAATRLLDAAERRAGPRLPHAIQARLRSLLAADPQSVDAIEQAKLLLYLAETCAGVGAGQLFRAAALLVPAGRITEEQIAVFDAVIDLLDYPVRLANDVAGCLASRGGDLDAKESCCTILIPRNASGAGRAAAIVHAVGACRRLGASLEREIEREMGRLAAVWPSMAMLVRRGMFIGRRVYEMGHYATLDRERMSSIADELDRR
jgi:hypothetical protein